MTERIAIEGQWAGAWIRGGFACGLCSGLIGCLPLGSDDGPELWVNSQMHQIATGDEVPASRYCGVLGPIGDGSQGGPTDDIWMTFWHTRAAYSVRIGSYDQLLEERYYDRVSLASHAVDRFVVTTIDGARFSFMYWGDDSCEDCPPLPFEALPGDPWGCGVPDGEESGSEAQVGSREIQ